MEAFRISYRILFNISLLLEGYKGDVLRHVKVIPDKATNSHFLRYRMLPRRQNNTAVALIEVEPIGTEQGVPVLAPAQDEIFRFQVKFTDSMFVAGTHIDGYNLSDEVLMLSNEVNHTDGSTLLLSRPVAAYSAAATYKKGYIVRSGTSHYSALQPHDATSPHDVTDTAFWKPLSSGSFVSQADLQARPATVDGDTAMVIDIRHSAALPEAYRLLDDTLHCREVSYNVRLLNK